MLKGISPLLTPDLLKTLAEMGHGDEIILADAHFPGHSFCKLVHRLDGHDIASLLGGIMPLFELDSYDTPLIMMDVLRGDILDFDVEHDYMTVIRKHAPTIEAPAWLERFAFYERAQNAYACVMTGELRKYGNIILKKGVTPIG